MCACGGDDAIQTARTALRYALMTLRRCRLPPIPYACACQWHLRRVMQPGSIYTCHNVKAGSMASVALAEERRSRRRGTTTQLCHTIPYCCDRCEYAVPTLCDVFLQYCCRHAGDNGN